MPLPRERRTSRFDPRCLPTTGTLPRADAPFRAILSSAARPAFYGRLRNAERRSHVVLGLGRSTTEGAKPSTHARPPAIGSRVEIRKPLTLGPRSRAPSLFLERCVRAYSGPRCCLTTSATAYDVRAETRALDVLARTKAMTFFLVLGEPRMLPLHYCWRATMLHGSLDGAKDASLPRPVRGAIGACA